MHIGDSVVKQSIAIITALLLFGASSPAVMAQTGPTVSHVRSNSGGVQQGETSDRTPTKHSPTPAAQIDTTADGETSDRTPSNHGEVQSKTVAGTN
jgi:hypothetical protein